MTLWQNEMLGGLASLALDHGNAATTQAGYTQYPRYIVPLTTLNIHRCHWSETNGLLATALPPSFCSCGPWREWNKNHWSYPNQLRNSAFSASSMGPGLTFKHLKLSKNCSNKKQSARKKGPGVFCCIELDQSPRQTAGCSLIPHRQRQVAVFTVKLCWEAWAQATRRLETSSSFCRELGGTSTLILYCPSARK